MATPLILGGGYAIFGTLAYLGFMAAAFSSGEGMSSAASAYVNAGIWLAMLIPLVCAVGYTLTYLGGARWFWVWLAAPVVLGLLWIVGRFTLFGGS